MNLLKLSVFSIFLFLLFGCAEKKPVIVKEFYAEDLQDFLNKTKAYSVIESVLKLQYEDKKLLEGDAFLKIDNHQLLLRVYYKGFLAGEVFEENGMVTSNLSIDDNRLSQLVIGIRKGFFWWQGDFFVEENYSDYLLKDKDVDRVVILDKAGFIPLRQNLNIEGQSIIIIYDNYSKVQTEDGTTLNMPMSMVVYYKNKALKIKIERIKIYNA
jgi:hypothetical protein